ncbi:MAG TPA: hypothetical protein DD400_01985 [Rhodospirillaceae bacterium]|nr:hypothetical protein [Rhodospirillaceae bacterium]
MRDPSEEKELPLVLVTDDDPLMRRFHEKLLKDIARITMATDTYEAEEKMHSLHPALVLLDDIMPNCPTGLTLLEKVKKDEALADIPIIMVTASNKKEEVMRGLQAGASAYITKPVDSVALRKAACAELDKRSKVVWIVMQDKVLGKALEELFLRLKCEVLLSASEEDVEAEKFDRSPDLVLVGRVSEEKTERQQFEEIRTRPFCNDVPLILIAQDEEAGEGLSAPFSFLLAPVEAQEVALQAARLMRSS